MMNPVTEAHRNLVDHFRAVIVQTEPDAGPDRLGPPAAVLARWLQEYHEAFLEANAALNDGRMHALHGRMLTLVGDHLLTTVEDVVRLSRVALACAMSTTLTLSVTAMAAHPHALAALRDAAPLQYRVDCTGLDAGASAEALGACRATLAAHAAVGGNLALVGDLGALRATGMFDDELFNRNFVSIIPRPLPETRHMNRPHAHAPCRDFIAWFVDAGGHLYPCAGLVGHAPARFGSVHEPFARLVDALAYSEVAIDRLARRGPCIDDAARFPADLCALHRQAVHGIASL